MRETYIALVVALLLMAFPACKAKPSSRLSCGGPISGAENVLDPGTILLLGEIHGTNEIPDFVATLACLAVERGPVTVGLEIPSDEQARIDRYLASAGDQPARASLIASPFWKSDMQDGRGSVAMAALLERLRRLASTTGRVRVVAYDQGLGDVGGRDEAMAAHLIDDHERHQRELLIVLSGNVHNRVVRGTSWDPAYAPMGWYVARQEPFVISLDFTCGAGTAWICHDTCGIKQLRAKSPFAGRRIAIDAERGNAYHGTYDIGIPSASLPAVALSNN
jgi:hypothetical protein